MPAHWAMPWLNRLKPATTAINKKIKKSGLKGLRSTEFTPLSKKASTFAWSASESFCGSRLSGWGLSDCTSLNTDCCHPALYRLVELRPTDGYHDRLRSIGVGRALLPTALLREPTEAIFRPISLPHVSCWRCTPPLTHTLRKEQG